MKPAEFERRAAEVWNEIPAHYREGVDGLVVRREARRHPTLPDIYTLGECLTEAYPSEWGGPDTTRSILVLYHGSFRALSELDPAFDWDYEIWETVTHELRHHLESLAAEDALEDLDYAMDENFKRLDGQPFDPFFYRSAEAVAPGIYVAEGDAFLEIELAPDEPVGPELRFQWAGSRYVVDAPEQTGDITFLQVVEGVPLQQGQLCVVVVRRHGLLASLQRWIRGGDLAVVDVDVNARPDGPSGAGDPTPGPASP